jgi:hypothetical protein
VCDKLDSFKTINRKELVKLRVKDNGGTKAPMQVLELDFSKEQESRIEAVGMKI